MDDFLKSFENPEVTIGTIKKVINALAAKGFRLTKFMSNDRNVIQSIPESEVATSFVNLDLRKDCVERTLGMYWNIQKDTFEYKPRLNNYPNTKRGILSTVASIFDPLGYLTPSILQAKLIIQNLWQQNIDWDENIPSVINRKWEQWKNELPNITSISFPRWFGFHTGNITLELHIFCDASSIAYGAVAYFRAIENETNRIKTAFIFGKSRIAPLKEKSLTIPKLELQATVTAIRLKNTILEDTNFEVKKVQLWCDSKVCLNYIRNKCTKFPVYIMNRLNEIHLHSKPDEWHYIPGRENPADMCTRELSFVNLKDNSLWKYGPTFLLEEQIPTFEQIPNKKEIIQDNKNQEFNARINATNNDTSKINKYNEVIKWNHYSNWFKLLRHVSWILKIKNNWISKKRKTGKTFDFTTLTPGEISTAERVIYEIAQMESFPQDYVKMSQGEKPSNKSPLLPLKPFFKDNLIRVGGRIGRAYLPMESKHQVILCKNHPLSKIIVLHFHIRNMHSGRNLTIASTREKYWIITGKALVRKVIYECSFCKQHRSSTSPPLMCDLPKERLAIQEPPFNNTGIDYFGPLKVKINRNTRRTSGLTKRYGAIFTCLTTRAIHIELAGDLSTDSFLLALTRFMSRRGNPTTITSDNGTNFVGAEKEIKENIKKWNVNKINVKLQNMNVNWKFNPPLSPWMGGAMESMVKITKKALQVVTRDRIFTEEVITTLLTEIESIVNSRPLTPVSDDIEDYEALTPNHFLIGRASNYNNFLKCSENNLTSRQKWKAVQAAKTMYEKRWLKEYLPTLTTRSKWLSPQRNFKVGDLVIIRDKEFNHKKWNLARVTEVTPSIDGTVRVVKIKTSEGEYTRPAASLCLLEESPP